MLRISRTPYNELGIALEGNLRAWTKTTEECYYNGLMCSKCTMADDLKMQCKLKPVVLELVKKFGRPHKEKEWEENEN